MTGLEHLRPSTLRALAAALEARLPPERLAACDLSDEGVKRLGEMLTQLPTRSLPAIGFWLKYRKPRTADPLHAGNSAPRGTRVRTLAKAAADMEADGWPADVVAKGAALVASERGLEHFEVAA